MLDVQLLRLNLLSVTTGFIFAMFLFFCPCRCHFLLLVYRFRVCVLELVFIQPWSRHLNMAIHYYFQILFSPRSPLK